MLNVSYPGNEVPGSKIIIIIILIIIVSWLAHSERRNEIGVSHVGLLSFVFYSWLDPIMWTMFRRPDYDPADTCRCPDTEKASVNADRSATTLDASFQRRSGCDTRIKGTPHSRITAVTVVVELNFNHWGE